MSHQEKDLFKKTVVHLTFIETKPSNNETSKQEQPMTAKEHCYNLNVKYKLARSFLVCCNRKGIITQNSLLMCRISKAIVIWVDSIVYPKRGCILITPLNILSCIVFTNVWVVKFPLSVLAVQVPLSIQQVYAAWK